MIYTYQERLKGKQVGVVFGTFAPLHQGHLDVIMRAKKECDGGCVVIVDGRDGDRGGELMPLKKRYRYVREFFADDDLVAVYPIDESELGIEAYPNGWDKFMNKVEEIIERATHLCEAVFYVSEEEYATHLNSLGYEVVKLREIEHHVKINLFIDSYNIYFECSDNKCLEVILLNLIKRGVPQVENKKKQLLIHPNITTRGFVLINENEALIKKIETMAENVIIDKLKESNVTFNDIKSQITSELFPYIYELTGRKPIILPVILDIKN